MIIERFNAPDDEYTDEIINIINKAKQKTESNDVHYILYSITLFNSHYKLYDEFKIKPDSLVSTTTLEKCIYFYELYKDQYDALFIVKKSTKQELLSDDDIKIAINSKKYNI